MWTETGMTCDLNAESDDALLLDDAAWIVPVDGHARAVLFIEQIHIT